MSGLAPRRTAGTLLHCRNTSMYAGAAGTPRYAMPIRLKDIAQDLGVSVITVSKAVRGKPDISEATRQRVLTRMKELDYQPNLAARALATGHSHILGLIVPDLLNPFFTELAKSLSAALRRHAYALILTSSENDPEIERSEIRMMLARGVDALLISSCQETFEGLSEAGGRATPFILVDRAFPQLRAHFVGADDVLGGRLATEHLLALGRERLAYIGSPDLSPGADRFRGFRDALRDHNAPLHKDFILPCPSGQSAEDTTGYDLMQRLLTLRPRPDGVFCHNDVIAIGAMKATLDAGLSIPGDIAFVGFDNVRYSRYLQIPLTSVDQYTGKLGDAVAELALNLVHKKNAKPKSILLAPTLIVRQSSVGDLDAQPLRPRAEEKPRPATVADRVPVGGSVASCSKHPIRTPDDLVDRLALPP